MALPDGSPGLRGREDDSPEVVRLDVPLEQEDGSSEVVLPDGSPGLREREDDWLQVARLDVPQEQEDGWPEVALPDGSLGLREHSASPRWPAAQQDHIWRHGVGRRMNGCCRSRLGQTRRREVCRVGSRRCRGGDAASSAPGAGPDATHWDAPAGSDVAAGGAGALATVIGARASYCCCCGFKCTTACSTRAPDDIAFPFTATTCARLT